MAATEPQALYTAALQRHRAGDLGQAEKLYRQVLLEQPEHANALHLLGAVIHQARRDAGAADLIRRALEIDPDCAQAWNNLGVTLKDQGLPSQAIPAWKRAIELNPRDAEAHYNLGTTLAELGHADEAIASYRRAVEINPRHALAWNNLGIALRKSGQPDAAVAAFARTVELAPAFRDGHLNLGIVLRDLGQLDQALAACRQAIALDPTHAGSHLNTGHALRELRRADEAVAEYRRAIALEPARAAHYQGLAMALELHGKLPEAIAALKAAQARAPDSAAIAFDLAALGVGPVPSTMPRTYVVEEFDEFSRYFDQRLMSVGYVGPQLLLGAIVAINPPPPLDILDAGCGTGLCGVLFRPMARRLSGVDLSPGMIKKAAERAIYDELIQEDLTLALNARPQSCDLILAADVLIYIGAIEPVFAAAAAALRPGGLFAFTVENLEAGDFALGATRRYAQSEQYIRRVAERCNLQQVSLRQANLRNEGGSPVDGRVFVLRAG